VAACVLATAALGWQRPGPSRSAAPSAERGCVGAWRRVRPLVAARWGGLAPKRGRVTFGPRPCAIRQEREAWGQPPPALPRLVEKLGRTQDAAPHCWPGPSVYRPVEVEDGQGQVTQGDRRLVVVHARHLAQ